MALCQSVRLYLHLHPCLVHWEDTQLLSWVTLCLIVLLFVDTTSLSRVQIILKTSTNVSWYLLQKTSLTSFLQTSHVAENALFSEENKEWELNCKPKKPCFWRKIAWATMKCRHIKNSQNITIIIYNLKIQQRRWTDLNLCIIGMAMATIRETNNVNEINSLPRIWTVFSDFLHLSKCQETRHGRF